MTKTILWIGGIFAILNLLIGLIVSAIGGFNIAISTIIIVLTSAILLWVSNSTMKDGYKVSLSFIIPTIGLIQYLCALFMPNRVADNLCLIAILLLLAFEAIMIIGAKSISSKIQ